MRHGCRNACLSLTDTVSSGYQTRASQAMQSARNHQQQSSCSKEATTSTRKQQKQNTLYTHLLSPQKFH
eukprot:3364853-Amphidinium_carterae.1